MVQTLNRGAYRQRLSDYLCACGAPVAQADTWAAQIIAGASLEADLTELLRRARQRINNGEEELPPAMPPAAPLEMPTQTIPLRSVCGLIDSACQACLPLSRRLGQQFYGWLRSL
jgi:hypothetical protein